MTDTTKTKDEPPVVDPEGGEGGNDDTKGSHEGNGTGTGTGVSPMGSHEGNSAPTGTTT